MIMIKYRTLYLSGPVIAVEHGKVRSYPVTPLASSDIVDTNGAGDAFVGGFLAQRILGQVIFIICSCIIKTHH